MTQRILARFWLGLLLAASLAHADEADLTQPADERAAKDAIAATAVTLDAKSMSLVDALQAIEKQTGNKAVDHRQRRSD